MVRLTLRHSQTCRIIPAPEIPQKDPQQTLREDPSDERRELDRWSVIMTDSLTMLVAIQWTGAKFITSRTTSRYLPGCPMWDTEFP
jgi:hypothetical protein